MDPNQVVGVGIFSIPVILILIEIFKRIFTSAPGWVWLVCALLLGAISQVLGKIAAVGPPISFADWVTLIGAGVTFGAATSKAYDETLKKIRAKRSNGGEA